MIRRFLHMIRRLTGGPSSSPTASHPKPGHPATPADHPRHRRPPAHSDAAVPADTAPHRAAARHGAPASAAGRPAGSSPRSSGRPPPRRGPAPFPAGADDL
ncbi:MAG: hypothetical protein WC708_10730, partial [Lentisphaeria bacterium]